LVIYSLADIFPINTLSWVDPSYVIDRKIGFQRTNFPF